MKSSRILAFVMAGGEGRRLHPLTADCPKPALPLGDDCCLIDFALSNLYNSDVRSIYVLAQYCPERLLQHIATAWSPMQPKERGFVKAVLPASGDKPSVYRGTADSVWKNLHLVEQMKPDIVAIFAADHVYRMDVRQMVEFHQKRHGDVTVAAIPVPIEQAGRFGIISADAHGRIERFDEKPLQANPMTGKPDLAFASMGNYLFNAAVLHRALEEADQRGEHDFGHHVLPRLLEQGKRLYAYDFHGNRVPGVRPHEEPGYWRDVGTRDAYAAAQNDVTGLEPRFELHNAAWPIHPFDAATSHAVSQEPGLSMHQLLLAHDRILRDTVPTREVFTANSPLFSQAVVRECVGRRNAANE